MRITHQLLKKAKDAFKLKGEEFNYWKKYVHWEKVKNFYVRTLLHFITTIIHIY